MPLPDILSNHLVPVGLLVPPELAAAAAPEAAGATVAGSIAFTMHPQEQSNWCWAALSISVAKFFNTGTPWTSQCKFVGTELGWPCCPMGNPPIPNPNMHVCNVPWHLDRALKRVGHFKRQLKRALPLSGIRTEIDASRPLGVRIGWSGGGGHFVVLSGYSVDGTIRQQVTIEDPMYGQSTMTLSAFKTRYQGTGHWTHTYWMQ